MRFVRHAKIFRGQLDAAPFTSVFMLLMVFVSLGSMLYTPGVLLTTGTAGPEALITVTRDAIQFKGQTYTNLDNLDSLREDLSAFQTSPQSLRIEAKPGASEHLVEEIKGLVAIQQPEIDPRSASILTGTTNPVALVTVNLRGQFFFEDRLLDETALARELRQRCQRETNLTLVLLSDNAVNTKTLVRLVSLAKNAGITDTILSARPGTFSTNR